MHWKLDQSLTAGNCNLQKTPRGGDLLIKKLRIDELSTLVLVNDFRTPNCGKKITRMVVLSAHQSL